MADVRRSGPASTPAESVLAGRYRLERRIAIGGMAEVWAGTDTVLRRPVAVKLLKPALYNQPAAVERFRREAVAAAKVRHPNVVAVYDTVSHAGTEAIVMELVDGMSLRTRLDDQPRLPISEVASIAVGVTRALAAAHQHGLVHRDIKPANILLAADGRVLLSDFGIAKGESTDQQPSDVTAALDLTSEHVMLGTAKYLSPEQVMGQPLDGRSDLYALGAVLYESLTGRPPFLADDDVTTALARLRTEPVPIRRLRTDVPGALEGLVQRLLLADPRQRPANARAVLAELALIHEAPGVDGTRPLPASRRGADVTVAAPRHPVSPPRDASTGSNRRPVVASSAQHKSKIPLVVSVHLMAAFAFAAVAFGSTKTKLKLLSPPERTTPTTTSASLAGAGPRIAKVSDFDPPPGDQSERPELLPYLTDGNLDTAWTSEVYKQRNFAGKGGIGLIVALTSRGPNDTLKVVTSAHGWGALIYESDEMHDRLKDWGKPVQRGVDLDGAAPFQLGASQAKYVLVWFTDPGSDQPQYRLTVRELQLNA
ncbi:MAG: serine/threonine protein kinase [Acidimicrobiia bacterium]|nr:serine/threonine protein kinase [Acidimicrobiia bacterium]